MQSSVADDECAVVERSVLEEDVLNHPRRDVGIDRFARLLVFFQFLLAGNDDECTDLGVRHVLAGEYKLMNLCLPKMREEKTGIIINVSSIGAVRAAVGNGFYSASKAALELVSDAVGKETEHLGIKVMTVEPGAFRTSFYDSLHGASRAISDYTPSVGSMRLENMVNNHDQKGDPDKAGKLIVELVSSGNLPKRLPLGSDAVRIIRDELKSRLAEVEKTESYSITTDY